MGGEGAIIAAAAAKKAREQREEEEKLTKYTPEQMDGWEFKIIRSNTGYFRKTENLKKVLDEEAQAGWEMVEKFDNNRVRLKRRIDRRGSDQFAAIDPYRTTIGIGEGRLALVIVGLVLLMGAAILLLVLSARGEMTDVPYIALGAIAGLALLSVAAIKRSKK